MSEDFKPTAGISASDPVKGHEADQQYDYAEERSVRDIHAVVLREQHEPSDGREPISLWLLSFFFLTLMAGGYYLGAFSGGFNPSVFDERAGTPIATSTAEAGTTAVAAPSQQDDMLALGRSKYRNCASCHQASGGGQAGQYPSLIGSAIATGEGGRMVRIILHGAQGPWQAKSGNYNGVMLPWASTLKDKEIAAVINYVRQSWGNSAPPISEEQVAAIREETKSRTTQYTFEELMAEPDTLPNVGTPASGNGDSGTSPPQAVPGEAQMPPSAGVESTLPRA